MNVAATGTATAEFLPSSAPPVADFALPDDLARDVYCMLGIPLDAIRMPAVLGRIRSAAAGRSPFLLSTPNLNCLVNSQLNKDYRDSLLRSDLCTVDGMPLIWIAWLAGIPIRNRLAGSDIFDALKAERSTHPLKVFLFGGPDGAAAAASRALNSQPSGVYCTGWLYPGFCSAEEMSRDDIIERINSSGADFLVASLGSQKGKSWLQRNHDRLLIPVRAHLGASLNFQAGTVSRAPVVMRKLGLEWLWRIKEEPYLWRRYWNDGSALLRLLFARVIPLAFWTWWLRLRYDRGEELIVDQDYRYETIILSFYGPASAQHVDKAIRVFNRVISTRKHITLDLSNTRTIDARFLGLLLMLKKKLGKSGRTLAFVGLSPGLKRILRLNRPDFMASSDEFI